MNLLSIMNDVAKLENARCTAINLTDRDIITDISSARRSYRSSSIAMLVDNKGWILVKMDDIDRKSTVVPAFFSYVCDTFLELNAGNVSNELTHAKSKSYIGDAEEMKKSVMSWLPHITDAVWKHSVEILFDDDELESFNTINDAISAVASAVK